MGERTHIDWAAWDAGLAASFLQWRLMRRLDTQFIAQHFGIERGVATLISEINAVIPQAWTTAVTPLVPVEEDLYSGWWGLFPEEGYQQVPRPSLVRNSSLIFTISDSFKLHFDHVEHAFEVVTWTRVRLWVTEGVCTGLIPLQQVLSRSL